LMHAALGGHIDIVRTLLDARAHVNAEDEDRLCPLHFAAKAGNDVVFTMLLEARADPCSRDVEGLTPIDYWASEAPFPGGKVSALHDGNRYALMQVPTEEDAVKEREDLALSIGSFEDHADGPILRAEETYVSHQKGNALCCSWACHPRRPPIKVPDQNSERNPELELPKLLGSIFVPCYLPQK